MVKEQQTPRKALEGHEEEKESSGGHPQARSRCHVEAAFHCWTRENITVEQRARKELQLFYIVSPQSAAPSCMHPFLPMGSPAPAQGLFL